MSEWNGTPPFKKTLARRQINSSEWQNTCFSTLYTVSTRQIFSVHPQAEETLMAKFKPALYFISKRPSHRGSDEMQCDELSPQTLSFGCGVEPKRHRLRRKWCQRTGQHPLGCAIPAVHSAVFVLVYERKSGVDWQVMRGRRPTPNPLTENTALAQ